MGDHMPQKFNSLEEMSAYFDKKDAALKPAPITVKPLPSMIKVASKPKAYKPLYSHHKVDQRIAQKLRDHISVTPRITDTKSGIERIVGE